MRRTHSTAPSGHGSVQQKSSITEPRPEEVVTPACRVKTHLDTSVSACDRIMRLR